MAQHHSTPNQKHRKAELEICDAPPPEARKRLSVFSAHGSCRGHQGPNTKKSHFLKPQRKKISNFFWVCFFSVHQDSKKRKKWSGFDVNKFSETATEKKFNFFSDFWGVQNLFVGWGPDFFSVPRPLQKPVNGKTKNQKIPQARRWRRVTAKTVVLSVGSLTNKSGVQLTKWPPAAPQNGRIPGPRDT